MLRLTARLQIVPLLTLFLVLLFPSIVWATEAKNMGRDLVSTDFKSTLAKGMWLVEFFSPYCPHCKRFAPTWATLVEMHEHLAESSDFHFGRVDCISQGDICSAEEIKGYPSMFIYIDGTKGAEYSGDRSYELLSTFVLSQAAEHRKAISQSPGGARIPSRPADQH